MRSNRLRVGLRVQAALTTLVFLVAGLLGVLHEATTTHVRCAAHGELVDSDAPVAAVRSLPATHAQLTDAQPSAGEHGDEHCLIVSAVRASRVAPLSPAISAATVAIVDLVFVASGVVQLPSASVYRIAPKTSPPA